ncbi:hypothetical protein GCM10022236_35520 [Microlunatus ginsengisoli]|uniref:Uncharacterized protein n=1 Tax=Microlunatus ginsengisoli TaxID=363863 RepID=A0ABP7ADR2_9ACTN
MVSVSLPVWSMISSPDPASSTLLKPFTVLDSVRVGPGVPTIEHALSAKIEAIEARTIRMGADEKFTRP